MPRRRDAKLKGLKHGKTMARTLPHPQTNLEHGADWDGMRDLGIGSTEIQKQNEFARKGLK